jgi:hypothetical protein
VYFFFVETRGYTLEQISSIFDTKGLTWKQRRNLAPVQRVGDSGSSTKSDEYEEKDQTRVVVKEE